MIAVHMTILSDIIIVINNSPPLVIDITYSGLLNGDYGKRANSNLKINLAIINLNELKYLLVQRSPLTLQRGKERDSPNTDRRRGLQSLGATSVPSYTLQLIQALPRLCSAKADILPVRSALVDQVNLKFKTVVHQLTFACI